MASVKGELSETDCLDCEYCPEWGANGYDEAHGECRWPCPPCLTTQMRPIYRNKTSFKCLAFKKK